jgi:hypothetical protein
LSHERLLDLDHVVLRDAFGDANHQRHLGLDGLEDGGGGAGGRDLKGKGCRRGEEAFVGARETRLGVGWGEQALNIRGISASMASRMAAAAPRRGHLRGKGGEEAFGGGAGR